MWYQVVNRFGDRHFCIKNVTGVCQLSLARPSYFQSRFDKKNTINRGKGWKTPALPTGSTPYLSSRTLYISSKCHFWSQRKSGPCANKWKKFGFFQKKKKMFQHPVFKVPYKCGKSSFESVEQHPLYFFKIWKSVSKRFGNTWNHYLRFVAGVYKVWQYLPSNIKLLTAEVQKKKKKLQHMGVLKQLRF